MKTYQLTESQIHELIDVCYNNSKADTIKWVKSAFELKEDQSQILDELCYKYPNDFELGREARRHSKLYK